MERIGLMMKKTLGPGNVSWKWILLAAGMLFAAFPAPAGAGEEEGGGGTCYACHLENAEDADSPASSFADDIHYRRRLGCSGCHGGDSTSDDPDEAMSEEAGFIGAPDREDIPALCGKCHSNLEYMRGFNPSARTDQMEEYFTSVHGKRLVSGDTNVATCADCHDVHKIRPVDEPKSSVYPLNIPSTCGKCHRNETLMSSYGIPSDQVKHYTQSVHGKALLEKHDLSAPTCNDCHGNHGATPPGVESVAYVCGMCHATENELFQSGPKGKIFRDRKMPGCVSCHTHHEISHPTEKMISFDENDTEGLCLKCHSPNDEKPRKTAIAMRALLDTLTATYAAAEAKVLDAEQRGMEVSGAHYMLKDATQKIFQSRTYLHTFNADEMKPHALEGTEISKKVLALGEKAIHDYYYRRRGFAISTLILSLLAVTLYLKIRSLD